MPRTSASPQAPIFSSVSSQLKVSSIARALLAIADKGAVGSLAAPQEDAGLIDPPPSVFLLSKKEIGGTTTFNSSVPDYTGDTYAGIRYAGSDELGLQIAYNVEDTSRNNLFYSVDIAPSLRHAIAINTLDSQFAHIYEPGFPVVSLPFGLPNLSNGWMTQRTVGNGSSVQIIAGGQYRNLVVYGSLDVQNTSAGWTKGRLTLRSLLMRFVAKLLAYAPTHQIAALPWMGDGYVSPPADIFKYPYKGTYRFPVYDHHDSEGRHIEWQLHTTNTPNNFTPFIDDLVVDYKINVLPSGALARRSNDAVRTDLITALSKVAPLTFVNFSNSSMDLPALHSWANYTPAIHCNFSGGFVYRNLFFLVSASSRTDYDSCESKTIWATRFLHTLLLSARDFVQHP